MISEASHEIPSSERSFRINGKVTVLACCAVDGPFVASPANIVHVSFPPGTIIG